LRGEPIAVSAIVGAARGKPSDYFNEVAAAFCAIAGLRIWTIASTAQRGRAQPVPATVLPDGYELPWALADRSRLDGCLEKLEVRARNVVLATFVDERDADDVGRLMGLSAGNVRVIRHRALAHLRDCMEGGLQA
jgi:RNA polymerase sigma factor (sigma-70 family)